MREQDFFECAVFSALRSQPLGFVDIGSKRAYHEVADPLTAVSAVLAFEPDERQGSKLQALELSDGAEWAQFSIEPSTLAGENVDEILFGRRAGQTYWGEVFRCDDGGPLQGAATILRSRTICVLLSGGEAEGLLAHGFSPFGVYDTARGAGMRFDEGIEHKKKRRLDQTLSVFLKSPFAADGSEVALAKPLAARGQHVLFACCLLLGYYDLARRVAPMWAKQPEEQTRLQRLLDKLSKP